MVLVHGAMDRAASFGRVMRRLGDLDVVAYDRRGYDGSLAAGVARTLGEHAADLASIVDWTGADRVVVVGHSLGGTIALRLAATGAVGVQALGAYEAPVPSLPGYRSDAGDIALRAAATGGPPAAAEAFMRLLVGSRAWVRLRDADRARRRAEGVALVAELEDLRRPGASPRPEEVLVPARVGAGGASGAPWREAAAELAARLPAGTLDVLADAGHGAHLTHPDQFARWVRRCAT